MNNKISNNRRSIVSVDLKKSKNHIYIFINNIFFVNNILRTHHVSRYWQFHCGCKTNCRDTGPRSWGVYIQCGCEDWTANAAACRSIFATNGSPILIAMVSCTYSSDYSRNRVFYRCSGAEDWLPPHVARRLEATSCRRNAGEEWRSTRMHAHAKKCKRCVLWRRRCRYCISFVFDALRPPPSTTPTSLTAPLPRKPHRSSSPRERTPRIHAISFRGLGSLIWLVEMLSRDAPRYGHSVCKMTLILEFI